MQTTRATSAKQHNLVFYRILRAFIGPVLAYRLTFGRAGA